LIFRHEWLTKYNFQLRLRGFWWKVTYKRLCNIQNKSTSSLRWTIVCTPCCLCVSVSFSHCLCQSVTRSLWVYVICGLLGYIWRYRGWEGRWCGVWLQKREEMLMVY